MEVMYTVIQSLTRDGRDRSLDYKISGMHVPPGSWQAKVRPWAKPRSLITQRHQNFQLSFHQLECMGNIYIYIVAV